MSVRTSTRSTKGQSKYRDNVMAEAVVDMSPPRSPSAVPDGKTEKKLVEVVQEEVHCSPCGANDDNFNEDNDPNGEMIQCDGCDTWQHIACMTGGSDDIEPFLNADQKYYCERCRPEKYPHLAPASDRRNIKSVDTDDEESSMEEHEIIDLDDNDDDAYVEEEGDARDAADDNFGEQDDEDEEIVPRTAQKRKRVQPAKSTTASSTDGMTTSAKRSRLMSRKSKNTAATTAPAKVDPDTKTRENAKKMFLMLFEKFVIPDSLTAKVYILPKGKSLLETATELAAQLEDALFNYCYNPETKQLSPFYKEKVRRLFSNLKDKKNVALKSHTLSGKLPLSKLVAMSINELANPDLQEFKVTQDAKSLNKITIEDKLVPAEQVEDSDNFNGDEIYEMDNIRRRSIDDDDDGIKKAPGDPASSTTIPNTGEVAQAVEDQPSDKIGLRRVTISYDETEWATQGFLKYIASTKEMDNNIYRNAADDGKLYVEGKLSSEKAFRYLEQVKPFRNVVTYQFIKLSNFDAASNMTSMVDSLLMCSKVLGLTPKMKYERVVYIIPAENNIIPPVLNKMYEDSNDKIVDRIEKFDKALFVVFLIKPDLVSDS